MRLLVYFDARGTHDPPSWVDLQVLGGGPEILNRANLILNAETLAETAVEVGRSEVALRSRSCV